MKRYYFWTLILLISCSKKADNKYSSEVYQRETHTLISEIITKNLIIVPDSIREYLPKAEFKLSPEVTHKDFYWVITESKDSILTKGAIKLPESAILFYEQANKDTSNWIIDKNSIGVYEVTDNCKLDKQDYCVHFVKPIFSPDYRKAYVEIDLVGEGKAMKLEKVNEAWIVIEKKRTWVE